jgi:hypothetical protein
MKPAKVVAAIFIFCLLKLANLKRLAVQVLSKGKFMAGVLKLFCIVTLSKYFQTSVT